MKGGGDTLSLGAVMARTGLGAAEIEARVRAGTFPPPLPLGPWANGWAAADVETWLRERR